MTYGENDMNTMHRMSDDDLNYTGFFDGQNKVIPDGTELGVLVTGGFVGVPEGKAQNICQVNVTVVTKGEFYGQKYKFTAKIFDIDEAKRETAWRNLMCLDAQAGFPLSTGKMEPTTENFDAYWAGTAYARAKFGLFVSEDDGREINFIRGFGFWREKMVGEQGKQAAEQASAQQGYAASSTGAVDSVDEAEIDF